MSKLDEMKTSKQSRTVSKVFSKLFLVIGLIAIIAIVIASAMLFLPKPYSNEKIADLAKCLSENGAKMYGTYWCENCKQQKAMFGDAFQLIKYVECQLAEDKPNPECITVGIEKFPTWEIDGEKHTGLKQLQELAQLSGCSLE